MIIKNTSRYPTQAVWALAGISTGGMEFHVKNSIYCWAGRAHWNIPNVAKVSRKTKQLATCRIGGPDRFPERTTDKYKQSQPISVQDWKECIIWVISHEARHLQQMRFGRKISEVDCLEFSKKRIAEYRLSNHSLLKEA